MAYDTIMQNLNEEYINRLHQKYDKTFETVAKFVPSFDDERATRLGILLENTDERFNRAHSLFESTQQSNILEGIKHQYFDIISAVYPNLIAEDLFSVQPLRYKSGEVFYLNTIYGSSKGNVKKGDTIFSNQTIAGYDKAGYSSDHIDQEILVASGDGTTTTFTGNLSYVPVEIGSVTITADAVIANDDGAGNLTGTGVTGTIDYNTGAYSLTYTTAPTGSVDATYDYNIEYAPVAVPEVDVEVKSYLIQARSRKLRGRYSLDAAYDLKQAQGIDLSDYLKTNSAQLLKHETDGTLINDAYMQAANKSTWTNNYSASSGISKQEYYQEFIEEIINCSGKIRQATKRVSANWLVVGNDGANILQFVGAPRFKAEGDRDAVGPHYAGTLDGSIKVYVNPLMAQGQYLVGYRGNNLLDAGLIYAPYLPFYCTDSVVLDDFLGRQGFSTSYGKKMVNSNLYVAGTILKP